MLQRRNHLVDLGLDDRIWILLAPSACVTGNPIQNGLRKWPGGMV
jgi:hypothetical protein